MNHRPFTFAMPSSRSRRGGRFLAAFAGFSLLSGALHAGPVPENLGSGLGALVESNLQIKAAKKAGTADKLETFNGFATEKASLVADNSIRDKEGRVMVMIHPNGLKAIEDIRKAAEAIAPSLTVKAMDTTYHGAGAFEGYVALDDVPAIARLEGVASVRLERKPVHAGLRGTPKNVAPDATQGENVKKVGTVYDFGVTQHRVDQISRIYQTNAALDYEGRNISVGVLSDSYDANTFAKTTAADDVASRDLPGTGNKTNTKPVVVLEDLPAGDGTDEGRAMCQTVYKMAPKAELAFASADFGELEFANNIRALAGLKGFTYPAATQQGFKADVIVDDVSYYDEPFFQDGIVAQGVNDVVAAGVSYFSSAANNLGVNGYDAPFRFVDKGTGFTAAAGNTSLANTNIDLSTVPPQLYAGGFQNFNPKPGQIDVAQTVNYPSAQYLKENYGLSSIPTVLQWNDPDDTTTPKLTGVAFAEKSGTITYDSSTQTSNTVTFKIPFTAGQEYYLIETPSTNPTTPGLLPLDGIVVIKDPSGNFLSHTDNGSDGDPEYVLFFAPVTGTYSVSISGYEAPSENYTTDGSFTLDGYTASGKERITQDLNLLVFDMNGRYRSNLSAIDNNLASNSPVEIADVAAPNPDMQVQFVISRSNTPPTTGRVANRLRYLCFGDGITSLGPAEYFDYLTPVTFGHSCAAGANGVAAYAYSKPNIPEYYTSPGPSSIYFDPNNNPYERPQVREKPDVAAMDGANTTFFSSDSLDDKDSFPNFYGTSDAAPHAAAIAALVLEAHGGSGSVTPAQMKSVLQKSTYPHDLDPYFSQGVAITTGNQKVTVSLTSDNETALVPGTTGSYNPSSFNLTFTGSGSLTSFVFNPSGSPFTAGNTTGGNNGLGPAGVYFQNRTPGFIFGPGVPFTLGPSSAGLDATTVTATAENPVTKPPNAVSLGRYFTQALAFTTGAFTSGKNLHFTVGRYEYQSADVTTAGGTSVSDRTGDLLGGGVSLPDGTIFYNGMSFSGTVSDGSTFSGAMMNQIGAGYSPVDGYGFIDAQLAVQAKLP